MGIVGFVVGFIIGFNLGVLAIGMLWDWVEKNKTEDSNQ